MLKQRDPLAYKALKKRPAKVVPPISSETWQEYVTKHFAPPPPPPPPPPARAPAPTWFQWYEAIRAFGAALVLPLRQPPPPPLLPPPPPPPPPPAFLGPNYDGIRYLVEDQLSRLKACSAAGFDGIPPQFIKYAKVARLRENGKTVLVNVLEPLLSRLFHCMITTGCMPQVWKVARISPLYKKGPVSNPNSYRMLAVSSVLYRLYANVVRSVTTSWCEQYGKVLDTQFGFYPKRSTAHPMFILRHLIKLSKFNKPRGSPRLYVAFMDFTQAYDHVNRAALWAHLQKIGIPPFLLSAIQTMYNNDSYILTDGLKSTSPVFPTSGVKQGCPLSPLLFSLFINDFSVPPEMGVQLQGLNRKVSHMFYADDLCLVANDPQQLQLMLQKLEGYSVAKGLTVNAEKSCVVAFNSRSENLGVSFKYLNSDLKIVKEFKYLGVVFHRDGHMVHAD